MALRHTQLLICLKQTELNRLHMLTRFSLLKYTRQVMAIMFPIIIMTDLEPDDMLALEIYRRRNYTCSLMIVGEGNPLCNV